VLAASVPEVLGESEPEVLGESVPEVLGESVPEVLGESLPEVLGESVPEVIGTSRPGGNPRAAGPRFVAARQTTLGHTLAPWKFISLGASNSRPRTAPYP